jgi:ADP-ribose pyrophosphatase YjhB (NUDIX family)
MSSGEVVHDKVVVACCALIEHDGSYLLVREGKARNRRVYNLPGGKLLSGETLAEGVVRETREETGLRISPKALIGLYHCPDTGEGLAVLDVIFWADAVGGKIHVSPAHPEVQFVSRTEVQALGDEGMLRGSHVLEAIRGFETGMRFPMSTIRLLDWPLHQEGSSVL